MTAGDLMSRDYRVVHPDASVEEVIRLIMSADPDPLPVCDGDRLIGMVGFQDVAASVASGRRPGGRLRARDLVAPDIIYCLETTELEEAVALMRVNRVRSLPVLNDARRLVGILALASVPGEAGPSHAEGSSNLGAART